MGGVDGRQHYGVTLGVLAVAALAYALSQTLVAPALPEIQRELGTTTTGVTWVLTVYLLSASVATPIAGRLGDMYGKERVLVIVLATFATGSLVAALSDSIGTLVAGRAIQGIGGAVFPLAFGIIRDEFPAGRVAMGIGLISATFGIGGGAGTVLSGVIVDNLGYQWLFWLGLVVVAAALVAARLWVPESPVRSPARIDWTGGLLLSGGLASLLLAISEGERLGWTSGVVLGLAGTGIVVLSLWVLWERRVHEPLVDIRMLRNRQVLSTNAVGFLIGFGMFGAFILIPQFVQAPTSTGYGLGVSVTEAGLFMLPSAAVMLVAGPLAGLLGTRFGSRLPLILGAVVVAVTFVLLAAAHSQAWEIVLASAALGLGIGFAFASMANLVVEAVPQDQTGVATGMNTITRTIGGSLGSQVAAGILGASVLASTGFPAESGYTIAFTVSAVAMLLAVVAGLTIPRRERATARGAPAIAAAR
jgi:EmrB/QacA subfamily drug resistance transporter